ncbi:EpsD family peptidyl-prolyl cis-trans isomerase [Inhella sp.]|uniref:EpsD family peptidyl-prolyl cis-trans isomerase n=1 Tax=Inhella sp. TaxID=1921806 RepID=UPI0035AE0FEE
MLKRGLGVLATALTLAACSPSDPDHPVAARVNREEISERQVDAFIKQQPQARPEQGEALSRKALDQLIDQELAVQKAEELRLHKDPKVLQQMEAARRQILAAAYADQVRAAAGKPTQEEVQRYYDANPALFAERRIYNLQRLDIEAPPEQLDTLRARLAASKNLTEFTAYLKAQNLRFAAQQTVAAANELPLASLGTLAQMKDGQSLLNRTPNGLQVVILLSSRPQPVDLERARPMIENFLGNQRRNEHWQQELKTLRAAAKIEYQGRFATAPAAPAASAPAAAGASAVLAPNPSTTPQYTH